MSQFTSTPLPGNLRKAHLSEGRRRLIELMQRLNFGAIEGLAVSSGEPVLDPAPRVVRELKFGGENNARMESTLEDFALKSQVSELLAMLDHIGTGVIERIEIKHGLPFRMFVTEPEAR